MKINITYNEDPKTLEEFAELHNLTMWVRERSLGLQHFGRFLASFEDSDVKDGSVLIGSYGNGNTPEEAIADYSCQIQDKLLVIDAYGPNRREIWVPSFIATGVYNETN